MAGLGVGGGSAEATAHHLFPRAGVRQREAKEIETHRRT